MRFPLFNKRLQQIIDDKKIQKQEFARVGGVSATSLTAYLKGRSLPSQDALEKWVRAYGVSGTWLLTGQGPMYEMAPPQAPRRSGTGGDVLGDRFSAENDAGQLIGDLLWEIMGLWNMEPEDFAKKARIPLADMENILASRRPPTWDELAKMAKRCHINPLHLLLGEDPLALPHDLLSRLEFATGLPLYDPISLASAFDEETEEVRKWMRSKGAKTRLPGKWMAALVMNYHLSPSWLLRGIGRTHLGPSGVKDAIRAIRPYEAPPDGSTVGMAAETHRRGTDAISPTQGRGRRRLKVYEGGGRRTKSDPPPLRLIQGRLDVYM